MAAKAASSDRPSVADRMPGATSEEAPGDAARRRPSKDEGGRRTPTLKQDPKGSSIGPEKIAKQPSLSGSAGKGKVAPKEAAPAAAKEKSAAQLKQELATIICEAYSIRDPSAVVRTLEEQHQHRQQHLASRQEQPEASDSVDAAQGELEECSVALRALAASESSTPADGAAGVKAASSGPPSKHAEQKADAKGQPPKRAAAGGLAASSAVNTASTGTTGSSSSSSAKAQHADPVQDELAGMSLEELRRFGQDLDSALGVTSSRDSSSGPSSSGPSGTHGGAKGSSGLSPPPKGMPSQQPSSAAADGEGSGRSLLGGSLVRRLPPDGEPAEGSLRRKSSSRRFDQPERGGTGGDDALRPSSSSSAGCWICDICGTANAAAATGAAVPEARGQQAPAVADEKCVACSFRPRTV